MWRIKCANFLPALRPANFNFSTQIEKIKFLSVYPYSFLLEFAKFTQLGIKNGKST
ncbi:hypothetical protein MHA_0661 [Mannheimia haemolytica PHL213]|nr:hypothetical protein MHA_0661 [Mannheimia haemolytica PHL213]